MLTWDCAAGDAIIIHPYTVHGAKGNAARSTAQRRVAITTRWFGDDVRWLPIGADLIGFAAGIGDVKPPVGSRPSQETFPVVWRE